MRLVMRCFDADGLVFAWFPKDQALIPWIAFKVDGKRYKVRNILLAVGGRPSKINIPGADLCITSDEALELAAAPKKATVLGAGYIAVEFSGIFNRCLIELLAEGQERA